MKKEVKIGLAGIGALLILFFGINYLKGISMFKPESYYYVCLLYTTDAADEL